MPLTEDKLTNKTAVFNEWIARYTELKPYTKDGVPRQLTANSLAGFNPPPGNQVVQKWIRKPMTITTSPASTQR